MSFIKQAIRNAIKGMGYDVIKHYEFPLSDFDKIYQQLFKKYNNENIIFDVGSHRGESIKRFNRVVQKPKIHAFEPDIENFNILNESFSKDTSIILNNCGIGSSNGHLQYHKYEKTDVGGFNKINLEDTWTKIRSEQLNTTPTEFEKPTYEVPVKKLDDYIEENAIKNINLLKIDTQGFEDEVLKGCEKALQQNLIDFIELELIIKGPYEKTLLFKDIEDILNPLGYKLYGIKRGSNYYDTPILQFDLLFASSDCYVEGNYPL